MCYWDSSGSAIATYFVGTIISLGGILSITFGGFCYTHEEKCLTSMAVDFGLIGAGIVATTMSLCLILFVGFTNEGDRDYCGSKIGAAMFSCTIASGVILIVLAGILNSGLITPSLIGAGIAAIVMSTIALTIILYIRG